MTCLCQTLDQIFIVSGCIFSHGMLSTDISTPVGTGSKLLTFHGRMHHTEEGEIEEEKKQTWINVTV